MKVAAITITYNRLALTKRTVDSFNEKTSVTKHLFIDNGSTDGTKGYLKLKDHIYLDKNYGIAEAFKRAVLLLEGYDYILKLDNDVETVTPYLVEHMLQFFEENGDRYVLSPVDLNLDPAYRPVSMGKMTFGQYDVEKTTHTGGAFQMIPYIICQRLITEFRHLKHGDYMIGKYFRRHGFHPAYMLDLEMRHIGINESTPGNEYIL